MPPERRRGLPAAITDTIMEDMPNHAPTPEEPTQSDLRALWRSMLTRNAYWGWHPVVIPVWFSLIPAWQALITFGELRHNSHDFSIATSEESLIIRLATLMFIWGALWWVNAREARHWPKTKVAAISRRLARGCIAIACAALTYGLFRVGPSGLLTGLASEWFESSIITITGPFFLLSILILGMLCAGRHGTQPHCAGCEYPIDDHMQRCPECGHTLSGPWRVVLGERAGRTKLAMVAGVIYLALIYATIYTGLGSNLGYRALAIVPDDRVIAAAGQRFWSDGVEYQIWSRAWNAPGDRQKLIDAMLALPDDVFWENHAELLLAILFDPDSPDDVRAGLLDRLDISIGGLRPLRGPHQLIVRMDPTSANLTDHQARHVRRVLNIACRVTQQPGITVGFTSQGTTPTTPPASPQPPPNWQPDSFIIVPQNAISLLGFPVELHADAPESIEVEVWLLMESRYHFGRPAFSGRRGSRIHRMMPGLVALQTADGRPDIGVSNPMAMRFIISVPTEFLRSAESSSDIAWSDLAIGLEHAK